jgi:hypothetical protein
MKLASFTAIVAALQDADVRYLVAGGLAVNLHGYIRLTRDVDLVVQLDHDNLIAAFRALATKGYRPSIPISAEQFSDPAARAEWIQSKEMKVLNFQSDSHPLTSVDVFVTEPFDFDKEYYSVLPQSIESGLLVRVVSLPTLIRMKQMAGRPRDLDDVQHLEWILEDLQKNADRSGND